MFIEYFFNNWFSDGSTGSVATYPRETWNHFDNTGPRTNNNGEAYNGKLGNIINKPNPNIWWFIELIKSENTYFIFVYYIRDFHWV